MVGSRFTGNACIYNQLADKTAPLFLRRNLDTVLKAHELALRKQTPGAPHEAMVANEWRSAGWDYPTKDMLEDLMKGHAPGLNIDGIQIRSLQSHGKVVTRAQPREQSEDQIEWLPDPSDGLRLPCHVTVTVPDARSTKVRFSDSRRAAIVQRTDNRVGEYFDIEFAEPLFITLGKLFAEKECGTNGFRHWKRTTTEQYSLEVTIQCDDTEDTAQLLSLIESRDIDDFRDLRFNESAIKAVWTELPRCPERGGLLRMTRTTGHNKRELKHGMEISMGWKNKKESPLAAWNQLQQMKTQQLPTPNSDDQEQAEPTQYVVRYSYENGMTNRVHTRTGLGCIFCASAVEAGKAEMYRWKSALTEPAYEINRLLLHYMTFHSAYEWDRPKEPVEQDGKVFVNISLKPKEKGSAAVAGERQEYIWQAPDRPFDISRHVAGDARWTGERGRKVAGKPGRARKEASVPELPSESTYVPPLRPKDPADVRDLPKRKQERAPPPDLPGVTFYHSTSKQPIRPDELLSESEDDLDDDRLVHSQRQALTEEHGLVNGERDFHEAFNRHMDLEQSGTKKLIQDAVVRFARNNHAQLRSLGWMREYHEHLSMLRAHNVIDAEVLAYCLEEVGPKADALPDSIAEGLEDKMEVDENDKPSDGQDQSGGDAHFTKPRAHGKFAKQANPGAGSGPPNGVPKKKHKWSGGGADKDIIRSGLTQMPNGSRSETSASPPVKQKSSDDSFRARTLTPAQDGQPPRSGRYKWKDGRFLQDDEHNDVLYTNGMANGHGAKAPATGPNGTLDGVHDREDTPPSIAHSEIEYSKEGSLAKHDPVSAFMFAKDSVRARSKPADDILVEDLDYSKFVKLLKRQLEYDPSDEQICWIDQDVRVPVMDEKSWYSVLRKSSGSKLWFQIRSIDSPDPHKLAHTPGRKKGKAKCSKEPPKVDAMSGDRKDVCVCGQAAAQGVSCIACDNPYCTRQNFHLACVGLERRTAGWLCEECSKLPA